MVIKNNPKEMSLQELKENIEDAQRIISSLFPRDSMNNYNKLLIELTDYDLLHHDVVRESFSLLREYIELQSLIILHHKLMNTFITEMQNRLLHGIQ